MVAGPLPGCKARIGSSLSSLSLHPLCRCVCVRLATVKSGSVGKLQKAVPVFFTVRYVTRPHRTVTIKTTFGKLTAAGVAAAAAARKIDNR